MNKKVRPPLLVNPLTGGEFAISRYTTCIGRSTTADIAVADRSVSRQHAVIYWHDHKYLLEDLGSTNGTKVNGVPIKGRVELNSGDEIKMGMTRLLFMVIPERGSISGVENDEPTVPLEDPLLGKVFLARKDHRRQSNPRQKVNRTGP